MKSPRLEHCICFIGMQTSVKMRHWHYNMCSCLLKLYNGNTIDVCVKNLWHELPEKWPQDVHFYDPSNTKKKSKEDDNNLLKSILQCIYDKGLSLDGPIKEEVQSWINNDIPKLLELFAIRRSFKQIENELHVLNNNSKRDTLNLNTKSFEYSIVFKTSNLTGPIKRIHLSEVLRDVACILCKMCYRKDPNTKVDGIWKTPPIEWPHDIPFENPHNRRNRCNKWDNERLVKALLDCCLNRRIDIPVAYQEMIDALKFNDNDKLIDSVVVWRSKTKILQAIITLEDHNLLGDKNIQKRLSEIGVLVKEVPTCLSTDLKAPSTVFGFKHIQTNKRNVEEISHMHEKQKGPDVNRKKKKITCGLEADTNYNDSECQIPEIDFETPILLTLDSSSGCNSENKCDFFTTGPLQT
ncbi:unnamed protein product [Mytilus edulis]|uniref:Uncharacterized protein n=1 Tax=Mytilus edulis TaxID=6550 RepID=A0A8S3T776_MYTED|nr:unnamed protein product [Mytilus edulis]